MSAKWFPTGPPQVLGAFSLQVEKTKGGDHLRFRMVTSSGVPILLTIDELFDLTDLLDSVCDEYADVG